MEREWEEAMSEECENFINEHWDLKPLINKPSGELVKFIREIINPKCGKKDYIWILGGKKYAGIRIVPDKQRRKNGTQYWVLNIEDGKHKSIPNKSSKQ